MALRKKLDYLEPLALRENGPPSSEDKHVKTYFCGDFEKLVQTTDILPLPKGSLNMTTAEAQAINSMNAYLKKQIIFRRNRKMTRAIMKMLENENRNETAFFAVGAGKTAKLMQLVLELCVYIQSLSFRLRARL